ncbi:huntingtin-interacting protein K-like [Sycon ciliatum]|uniref:huntingtin-interacting protein K-like n=1 Tax=Sycon ciliatum TaxID=27933 RepID=UPI0031F6746A|eukprot:scpid27104/ scgid33717/ Huntingtin-interacting protein K; Huntingtin yeast partner K
MASASKKGADAQPAAKKHDDGAADLERVTDYVEEIDGNTEGIEELVTQLTASRNQKAAEKAERERKLAKVSISKDDVSLLMSEMEVTKPVAERTLRLHDGNVVNALTALVNG